jgi:2-amino-4-hydroxy-6-hydroxymethyldihydropteridine diphosphokinase
MLQRNGGIYIALGANLPSRFGTPRETLEAALGLFASQDITILRRSSWWRSTAQPTGGQPDFVNAVVEVETKLEPQALLMRLHDLESGFGRVRRDRWEARVLDLDLIDYQGRRSGAEDAPPILPHPRLRERLFVLLPLQEVAPDWCHPAGNRAISDLIAGATPMKINRLC